MKILHKLLLSIFSLLLFQSHFALGTHIRAGEIIAVPNSSSNPLSYKFIIVGYTDTGSNVQFGNGEINFGDGSDPINLETEKVFSFKRELGDQIALNEFVIEHTFPSPGRYLITFREFNRNEGVLNMAGSVNTPFYIETEIIIDPFVRFNRSPLLLVPPIDRAATGVVFIHNPGAYDPDGDSLSYKLVVCKQDRDTPVNSYKFPNHPALYQGMDYNTSNQAGTGPPTFTLDSITGDLVWDAPGVAGEYNMAFIVEEWRKLNGEFRRIGYVTRDMQVIVQESDNKPPELLMPKDTCIVAGSILEEIIRADDPDGDDVRIESFGGVYEINSPASFTPNPPIFQPVIAALAFRWPTNGRHVRERPYEVQFKATDKPPLGPALSDIQTWRITVVGPAPENLSAEVLPGRNIQLNWNPYIYRAQADRMQVWRKTGSFSFIPDNCQTGIPEGAGYELVGEINVTDASFTDTNGGEGFAAGATYCYRLVAVWPFPGGGESYASEEACVRLAIDVPVLTRVSIEETSENAGEIDVRWSPPLEIDPAQYPPPYTYELLRGTGFSGGGWSPPLEIDPAQYPPPYTYELLRGTGFGGGELTSVTTTTDTAFRDTGLNTAGTAYYYVVRLFDGNAQEAGDSPPASSVRLEAASLLGAIELSWEAAVPWSNSDQRYPYHRIYRDDGQGGAMTLIDSVNVTTNGFTYRDEGQHNGVSLLDTQLYCYIVETSGSYNNPLLAEPLLNKSQRVCAQPNDTVPPCTPPGLGFDLGDLEDCAAFFEGRTGSACNISTYANTLLWEEEVGEGCDDDIRFYRVYYSRSGVEGSFEVVSPPNLSQQMFVHGNLSSFAGCYKITSVDRSGNESEFSETICRENCPSYRLPNIITPGNLDGKNDVFRPFDCPQFVLSVQFRVYNRWGKEVYSYSSDNGENTIFINWDGRSNSGEELASGVYYYVADVTYDMLDPAQAQQVIKGWVHVVR